MTQRCRTVAKRYSRATIIALLSRAHDLGYDLTAGSPIEQLTIRELEMRIERDEHRIK